MRKKKLEIALSKLSPSPDPKLRWEGYTLNAESAVEMVSIAGQINDDIRGKSVVDMGCGSGILAIAASILKADWVVGVDIDREAVKTARMNARKAGVTVDLIVGDIENILCHFDTTLMNPPFGSWQKGADVKFLRKALEISDIIYSLHKRRDSVREFLRRKIPQLGGRVDQIYEMTIDIRRTYRFHHYKRYSVDVDFYRTIRV